MILRSPRLRFLIRLVAALAVLAAFAVVILLRRQVDERERMHRLLMRGVLQTRPLPKPATASLLSDAIAWVRERFFGDDSPVAITMYGPNDMGRLDEIRADLAGVSADRVIALQLFKVPPSLAGELLARRWPNLEYIGVRECGLTDADLVAIPPCT